MRPSLKDSIVSHSGNSRIAWICEGAFEFLFADNKQAGAAVGSGPTFATDEIGGVDYPRAKLVWGVDGTATDASASNPLPVVQTGTPGLPTGAATAAKQDTEIASLATIAGAVSGTEFQVDVLTSALPTGAATAAKQPALGTAGASSTDVLSVQGIASGTAMPVSAASLPLPTGAATSAKQDTEIASLATLAGAVAGTEMQVDVLTMPTVTVNAHAVTNAGTFATQVDGAALTALQLIDDTVFAEDVAAQAGDKGIQILAVRRDANTSLVGTDNDYAPLQVNADGSLKVAITAGAGSGGTSIADDAAFTPASTSITPVGGTYRSTLDAVDDGDAGAFAMTANRALHVNLRDASGNELAAGAQYAEDAAHTTGDLMTMAGVVRRDSAAVGSGTDGDISTLNVNSVGRLYTTSTIDAALPAGTNAIGKLAANSGVDIGDVDITSIAAGDNNIGNVDIVTMPNVTLAAGTNTNEVVGDASHDAAVAGNPVRVGGRARTSDYTSVVNDDTADFITDLNGKQVVLPYAIPENFVSGAITSAMTGTTSTSLVAAPAAGLRNYLTTIIVSNAHATVGTDVVIQDGSGGTTLLTIPASAVYGGAVITLPVPLRQPTTATAIFCANVTTGASTKVSAVGYKAP